MAAPAGSLSPTERLAFCASLAPDIAQVTADFYSADASHPFLGSPTSGGTLQPEVMTSVVDGYAHISVHGYSTGDSYGARLVEQSGLPQEIAPEGILWGVITDHLVLPADPHNQKIEPKTSMTTEHARSYWDGKRWVTSRIAKDGEGNLLASQWELAPLLPEELVAMRALARQTRVLHQIADVYGDDIEQFERDIVQIEVDPETRKWLNIALASAMTLRREVEASGVKIRGYTNYFGPGFQRVDEQTRRIPLGGREVEYVSAVEAAIARMYRGSAVIKPDSMRKRGYRARMKGRPLPLPTAW